MIINLPFHKLVSFKTILVFGFIFSCFNVQAQYVKKDTSALQIPIKKDRLKPLKNIFSKDSAGIHSPRKAALRSAILPGWGQVYNKKKWKVPIVYTGVGISGGFIIYNAYHYNQYRKLFNQVGPTGQSVNFEGVDYTSNDVFLFKNFYRRNLDLSVISLAIIYTLNIIDANVDGHLFDFNVSDDLKANIQPTILNDYSSKPFASLQLKLSF